MNIIEKDLHIFKGLKEVNPNLILTNGFDVDVMDEYFNNTHKESVLNDFAEYSSNDMIYKMLNVLYADRWNSICKAFENALNIIPEFSNKETTTETKKETGNSDNTKTDTVSAYNTDDFSNNTQTDNTGKHELNNDNSKTVEKVNGYNVISTFQFLQNNDLYSIIVSDISKSLFMLIY